MFFHTHTHSRFSWLDAMSDVMVLAERAHSLGHQALGLTDHGNMGGSFQLYKHCKRLGILPFPGLEAYMVDDTSDPDAKRYHLTLLSFTTDGYKGLVKLSTLSHQRERFHFKPRIDFHTLALLSEKERAGIACMTGCFFSMLIQRMDDPDYGAKHVQRLQALFPVTYVEIQHHDTVHEQGGKSDKQIAQWLAGVAYNASAPTIITQDCHYCDYSQRHLHDRMKQLAYGGVTEEDFAFPGDSYHMANDVFIKEHFEFDRISGIWDHAQPSYDDLINMHQLKIPPLDRYEYKVPMPANADEDQDPQQKITDLCLEALEGYGPKYSERLHYELDIISQLGFADYFLIVRDYTQWMTTKGIFFNARGSANGSLVCYLIGITGVDPIKWKLSFDRFLTLDRERPPDIDIDVEDVRRGEVIAYLKDSYDIHHIGTYGRLGVDEEEGTGGVLVSWLASRRRTLDPKKFAIRYGKVKTLYDLQDIEPHVVKDLIQIADLQMFKSASVHAAGLVISAPDLKVTDWIPLMLIPSSETLATQMMMDDTEDVGLVKLDLLGLRSLTTLRKVTNLLGGKWKGCKTVQEVLDAVPLNDKDVMRYLREGNSENGIFQLEGYSAAKGCREMKVRNVEDIVLVNALYRPAARDIGYTYTYLDRRFGRETVPSFHPIFDKHLKPTLGIPAFQEQVLDIMREIGVEPAALNKILTAIKSKHQGAGNAALFAESREMFDRACKEAKLTERETSHAWSLVEGFSKYGFNRAHAVGYSLLGYCMAWFKIHHPLEFHTALLMTTAGTKKEPVYLRETRKRNVRVLGPDVNVSGDNWTIDEQRRAIRRGLVSIKGIGADGALEIWANSPYNSVDEIIERCNARAVSGGKKWAKEGTLNGVLEILRQAGALESLGVK